MSTELVSFIQPLTETEADLFLEELRRLLAAHTKRYTMGDSTSIPVETAQELLASICFTLQFEMEASKLSPRDLLGKELDVVLKNGQAHLAENVKKANNLWERVYALAEICGNPGIIEALNHIKIFLKKYDLYFFAHQTPWDMGLPLLGPAAERIKGISYVKMYLKELHKFILTEGAFPKNDYNSN